MSKTSKRNTAHKRNKLRRKAANASVTRGRQNNRPLIPGIAPTIPEYIAPTGIAASIGRFLGFLGKPKR